MRAPKSNTKDFESCPVGWTLGVCSRVIDKGTHWVDGKNGNPGKDQRKVSIAFEAQHLMTEGDFIGEPFLLYANFNYSMYQGKAFLCTFIENWRGRRFASQDEADVFDLAKLIGQKAYMNVVRSEDGKFTNIQVIGPVPDEMTAPEIKGKTILIDQDNLDAKEVEKLSEKMRERVMNAKEQTEVGEQQSRPSDPPSHTGNSNNPGVGIPTHPAYPEFDDDIPF